MNDSADRLQSVQWQIGDEMPIDDRDRGPTNAHLTAPHGHAIYALLGHVPGGTVRDAMVGDAHAVMRDRAEREPPEQPLCGVLHQEDVDLWQLPYTLRPLAKEIIRRLRARFGRRFPIVLIRAWQHIGPCPTTTSDNDGR